ncbi:hypothetical protein OPV22_029093 [Ensete ventricosum]|uniref:Uncharacterized protein n=1 Tax=Ensete ventricosum TaxID=4639 RepID=A0AAV8Q271_ENSVE|nr:hypothetical protein OPV22_029093 [Ensete ventricosum]
MDSFRQQDLDYPHPVTDMISHAESKYSKLQKFFLGSFLCNRLTRGGFHALGTLGFGRHDERDRATASFNHTYNEVVGFGSCYAAIFQLLTGCKG